jgi:hypothetical protein
MEYPPGFVEELRHSLLDLHKALLDAQQIRYEREHGRVRSSGELLGLVLEHPAFAWLRSLSALIARLDEWIEDKEEASAEDLAAMIQALRSLIESGGKDLGFNKPYWEIANEVPEVLVSHVKLWRLTQPAIVGADPKRPAERPRD